MTLQATMYGAGSIGASNQNPASDVAYCVPVTVTADGLAVAIEIGMVGGVFNPAAYLLADNGGVPGQVLAVFAGRKNNSITPSATARWLNCPVGYWITAGSYWIGGQSVGGPGAGQIRYTAGSSGDGYTVDGTSAQVLHEPATTGTTSTATSDAYSLRLVVLTEAAPPVPNTVTVSGDVATVAGDGTVTITGPSGVVYSGGAGSTGPLDPGAYTWTSSDGGSGGFTIAAGGGNRMGGTGAVRKPPR